MERKAEIQQLDRTLIEKYVGGVGIGAKILYDETYVDTESLDPENILVAFTGPYTGSSMS